MNPLLWFVLWVVGAVWMLCLGILVAVDPYEPMTAWDWCKLAIAVVAWPITLVGIIVTLLRERTAR